MSAAVDGELRVEEMRSSAAVVIPPLPSLLPLNEVKIIRGVDRNSRPINPFVVFTGAFSRIVEKRPPRTMTTTYSSGRAFLSFRRRRVNDRVDGDRLSCPQS